METISAIVDFTPGDNAASKMWELVAPYTKNTSVIFALKEAILLGKL
ncbi:MAG: hypothetical protein WCP92_03105 [bacterium]